MNALKKLMIPIRNQTFALNAKRVDILQEIVLIDFETINR